MLSCAHPNPSLRSLAFLSSAIALASGAAFASWTAAGNVRNGSGTAISNVIVSVKDSTSLKDTTDANGAFSITYNGSTGLASTALPSDFFVHQEGSNLVVGLPQAEGNIHATLVNIAGASLWQADATLSQGIGRLPFGLNSYHGPAILRVRQGAASWTQPLTLAGSAVAISQRPASARALANYPTLTAKKTGYADTTYTMTATSQWGISIVMRDSTSSSSSSTTCALPTSPSSGSGSFTYYYFSQGGTTKENNHYQTACGYHGYEPTTNGSSSVDTMQNIAHSKYFVAIPGVNSSGDFANVDKCGACVQLYTSSGAASVIATVTDECPENSNTPCKNNPSGHLDLSTQAFSQLGFSKGDPSGTTWKYVPCPISGNAVFRVKSGNSNEFYIENTIMNIKSVTRSGTAASRQFYGAWHFSVNLAVGHVLVITDYAGRSLTYTISDVTQDKNQDMKMQFPTCSSYTN